MEPSDVSGAMWPWLVEELEGDRLVNRHDMQRTHRGHAMQENIVPRGAFTESVFSGALLGDLMD